MRAVTSVLLHSSSITFDLLGRTQLRSRPRYLQQQSTTQKVMDGATLSALPAASSRGARNATVQAVMEVERRVTSDALSVAASGVDDDVVLDELHTAAVGDVAALAERNKLCEHHPAARGVGVDVIDLVTDAFKEERERLVAQRRRVLYELTHPTPSDYTYNGKLVPPPPLSFGRITDEAKALGNKVMLGQHYTLVKRAGLMQEDFCGDSAFGANRQRRTRQKPSGFDNNNFFFEINDLYQEIVLVGKACAGKSSLLNALLGQAVAKTSSTPNTTRHISFYQSVSPEEMQRYLNVKGNGLVKLPGGGVQLTFVDIPGFGIEGMSDEWRDKTIALTDAYLGVRRSVNTVLFCLDCERGLTKSDLRYFTWLENLHGVFFVVLTKCDSVPHSRVCSVMRQIYATITKNRRKYRKVFPFIIPTSAKSGDNIEFLRGLIAETSGLISGDKLRQILKAKANAEMEAALNEEAKRLQAAHLIGRREANIFFSKLKKKEREKNELDSATLGAESFTKNVKQVERRKFVLSLADNDGVTADPFSSAALAQPLLPAPYLGNNQMNSDGETTTTNTNNNDSAVTHEPEKGEKEKRRQSFLAWRHAHPLQRYKSAYGTFRLNTGLERPDSSLLELPYMEETRTPNSSEQAVVAGRCVKDEKSVFCLHDEKEKQDSLMDNSSTTSAAASAVMKHASSSHSSSVIGVGKAAATNQKTCGGVSRFLSLLEMYAQRETPLGFSKAQRAKEARWRERVRIGSVTRFFVEEEDGRLAEYKAGKKFGPSLVNPDCVEKRRAQWAARQYAQQAVAVRPTAPWAALDVLRVRRERLKQKAAMSGMKKKDIEAYFRNAGRVTEDFEKFEGEVTVSKYMNEIRQTKTLRSQEQMHLNSTAKISYRSMPVGLWKRYGERDTYWPTSSVKGH